jgi:hypothetical protein
MRSYEGHHLTCVHLSFDQNIKIYIFQIIEELWTASGASAGTRKFSKCGMYITVATKHQVSQSSQVEA